jgi:hypothetical protein
MQHPSDAELETLHGAFFGMKLDESARDALAIARIDRKILDREPALYNCKWFDYRPLHPTTATYLLAHCYNRAYGDHMGACFDRKKRFMAAFKGKDVMNCREVKSFWRLRQKIDELGMRYDFFCRHAMAWCAENGWKQPPRPSHVLNNDELIIQVANAWEMEQRGKIQWAKLARYTAACFVGGRDQIDYEHHLAARIMQRAHPKFAIRTALYQYDALRIEAALELLPITAVHEAIDMSLTP